MPNRPGLVVATLGLVVLLATSEFTLLAKAYAQEDSTLPESIKAALELQKGKLAKVHLVSGKDLEGKVFSVGTEVVVVSELTGMEFFSATVRIDQVAAVISRTDTR